MKNDVQKEIDAFRKLALADLDTLSDAELMAEIAADGGNPQEMSDQIAARLDDVVSQFLRYRTAEAKVQANSKKPEAAIWRPAMERIKQLIEQAFAADPKLATAFRDGKRQSDSDLQTLYDDLVDMGKINPDHDPR